MNTDSSYQKAISNVELYTETGINSGFNYVSEVSGKPDKILIAQNNSIIQLLIELNQKLEKIINKGSTEVNVDEITESFKNIQVDKKAPKEKNNFSIFQYKQNEQNNNTLLRK